jgi:hypothetical protein
LRSFTRNTDIDDDDNHFHDETQLSSSPLSPLILLPSFLFNMLICGDDDDDDDDDSSG